MKRALMSLASLFLMSSTQAGAGLTLGGILHDLYGPAYQPQNPVTIVNHHPERVRVWTTYSGTLGGRELAVVWTQGAMLQPGWNGKLNLDPNLLDVPADVSAVWYVVDHGKWVVAGRALSLFQGGQFGQIDEGGPSSPMAHPTIVGNKIIFHAKYSIGNHGVFQTLMPIVVLDPSGMTFAGSVVLGAQDRDNGMDFSSTSSRISVGPNDKLLVDVTYSGSGFIKDKGPVEKFSNLTCHFEQGMKGDYLTNQPECANLISGSIS